MPRKTPNGETAEGMMIAHTVFVRPSAWNSMYSGTVSRATGSRSPAMMMPTASFFPGKANLAIA